MLRWLIGRPDQDEVRLPKSGKDHESSVPGLHIVGDLAGAPTIRVAANQGYEVMAHIAALPDGRAGDDSEVHDVIIVGGGSSGITAALEAKRRDLNVLMIDAGRLANTIREFPKGKKIYAEPASVTNLSELWIEDSVKEELLEKWDALLETASLDFRECEEVTDIRRVAGAFEVETSKGVTVRGRRVLLAIGKRGNPRRLGVEGEDRENVIYRLYDAADHQDEDVLVVGGGDSAVEAALTLSEVGRVTLAYRKDAFFRLKSKNREKIEQAAADGRVELLFNSELRRIDEDRVTLSVAGVEREIGNDCVVVAIGADLPHAFFRKVGIRMEKEWSPLRVGMLAVVTLAFLVAYAAKKGPDTFPLNFLDLTWNSLRLGALQWWEWFTIAYSAVVLIFGIKAMRKYWYSRLQRFKYASAIFFQCAMLCIVPLWVMPLVAPDWYAKAGYAFHLVLAWPLSVQAISKPWHAGDLFPFLYALTLTFVVIPVFVYFFGSRFCSWICGCGALAETLGDDVRHLAPRGPKAIRFEKAAGRIILVAASVVTLLSLFASSWILAAKGMAIYGFWVDVLLAGAIGIGFYWFLGNRVWCRFFCPLRMYMNLIGSVASRFRIVPVIDKCISCGQCSRECQMGIPVMDFAKKGESVTLANSSCVGCGICVDVCPVSVLHYSEDAARRSRKEVVS